MSAGDAPDAVGARLTELLHQQIGLRPDPSLWGRLRRGSRDDAAERGLDAETYLDTVSRHGDALQGLIDRVTVQETSFFRHAEHFDALSRHVLPRLSAPVQIWSAACANGQEEFSLAMLLEEQGVTGSVVATDVSTAALARTAEARYSKREVTGLSPERIARHLIRDGDQWRISQPVRDRVTVERHNLLDALPDGLSACQVVFCRNVLIYFTPEHARLFLDRVADRMPSVTFFLGGAEAIWPLTDRFDTVEADGTFFYRPGTGARAVPAAAASAPPPRPAPGAVRDGRTEATAQAVRTRRRSAASTGTAAPSRSGRENHRPSSPMIDDDGAAARLSRTGQEATAAGAHGTAVVAFRKCAYLVPGDPMTHLHLGLALDATGDRLSAQRAYAAARHALLDSDPVYVERATGGYTRDDLVRLLDTKLDVPAP
jgi:chemotaxis methyl-accepting protein methylase